MRHKKSRGLRTVPCGTPESTGTSLDNLPFKTTLIVGLVRKSSSHLSVVPAMP